MSTPNELDSVTIALRIPGKWSDLKELMESLPSGFSVDSRGVDFAG